MTYDIFDDTPRFHLQRYKFPDEPAKVWVMNTDCLYIQYKTKPTERQFKEDLIKYIKNTKFKIKRR